MTKKTARVLLLYMLGCVIACLPIHSMAQSFTWHGYISQGITQSKGNEFITQNNKITSELTEIGINGRLQFSPKAGIVGQAVYLDGGGRFEEGARVDYLFLDWNLLDVNGWNINAHLGRFKNRHWLYSSTRDVPHTRPVAVLPQSVYFDGLRDVALGSDGADLQAIHYNALGSWEINWSYGNSPISDESIRTIVSPLAMGSAKQDFVHQVSAFWQPDSMNWRFGFSWLDSDFTYDASDNDLLVSGRSEIQRYLFAFSYFSEYWEINGELLRENQLNRGVFSPTFSREREGEGGYVHLRYHINPRSSVLLGVDSYVLDRNDRNGKTLQQLTGIPEFYGYMDSAVLGFRWDFMPQWRLQGEHHWVKGAAGLNAVLAPENLRQTEEYWQMWSLQFMHWF